MIGGKAILVNYPCSRLCLLSSTVTAVISWRPPTWTSWWCWTRPLPSPGACTGDGTRLLCSGGAGGWNPTSFTFPPGQEPSGTWAEVALEGIILFDRNLVLARRLVEFRKRILEGSLVRREIHGQPYWVKEG